MKKLLTLLVISSLGMLFSGALHASHIQGMNITYEHVNGDTYEIRCDFFRYCGGSAFNQGSPTSAAGLPGSASFYIYCEDINWRRTPNFTALTDTVIEATPICAELNATQNSCVAGYQTGLLGIQWAIYKYTLVIDQSTVGAVECDNWMFVYGSGARNNGVNYTSGSVVAYDRLNIGDFPGNSSVQFNTGKPIPFFCDGQVVKYNWGAYDPDGDSLWWELDTAWNSHATATNTLNSIPYVAPYTGQQPMPGTTTINNLTGQLDFVATIPAGLNFANYAVAITVKEYDQSTGAYKGEVHRDVQFIVLDSCDNTAPSDTGGIVEFNGDGELLDSNTIVVCASQDSFEFDLIYFDYDTSGNLSTDSITAVCNIDQILPGAIWTSSHTNPDTVHIKWVVQPTNQTFVPFNVTVEDDFCPVTGFNIYSYVIRIVPSTYLGPDTAICITDSIQLDAHAGDTFWWETVYGDPIIVGDNFSCAQCADPWINPDVTTMYRVRSNLEEACGNVDTIIVEVFDKFPIDLTPSHGGTAAPLVYCASDGLDTLISATAGGKYLGAGIVNQIQGVFAPDVTNPGSGRDTLIKIIYLIDDTVCANSDTIGIRIKGAPDAGFDQGPFCDQTDTVTLFGNFIANLDSYERWWEADGSSFLDSNGLFSPKQQALVTGSPDTLKIYHTVNDSGCVSLDSSIVRITGIFDSSIDSLPKICVGEELTVYLNNFEADPTGVWKGDHISQIPESSGNYYFTATGVETGSYDITYDIGGDCGSETTVPLEISELPDATIFGADSVYCDNIQDSVLLEAATASGRWGGSMNELHDGYFVPSRIGEGVYTISYELYDTVTTCYNKNVVPVRIARTPVQPKVFGGGPYCQGTELNNLRGDGLLSNTFKWYTWDEDAMEEAYEAAKEINPDSVPIPGLTDLTLLGAGNPFEYGALDRLPTETIYGTQMSKYGCESGWSKVVVEVFPSPVADFGTKDSATTATVPAEVIFVNESTVGDDTSGIELTYTWTFGPFGTSTEENPTFIFEEIGTYTITLVADNSVCQDEHEIKMILDRIVKFFIPNVFTPNGDGQNDVFEWQVEGIMDEDFNLKIFNRWGTKVYETDDITGVWDGKDAFLGGDAPDGTYFYVVQGVEDTNEQDKAEYRGDLTLIRK